MKKTRPPTHCAVCGADIQPHANACPECGADERTGWREQDAVDTLDLPEEEFDYETYVEKEFGRGLPRKGRPLFWWIVATVMLIVVVALVLLNRFWVAP
jgi:predicted nucleic acid-binding Zn ribbon protein